MIVIRAPLRISLIGGGTDIPVFFRSHPGRVISATIDKYIYLVINPTPLVDMVSARYSKTETVSHPKELEHARIKALLLDLGITSNIEIGSFASLPGKTGLGSSSSFSVALVKGLHAHLGRSMSAAEAAEKACELEIDILGEPIGKQDQYAAAHGGLNFYQFNCNGSVTVEPLLLDYKKSAELQDSMLLFYTGIERHASDVLGQQVGQMKSKFDSYIALSNSVLKFRELLLKGDIKGAGLMMHESWLAKKKLGSKVSNKTLDSLYSAGIKAGAWGGKVLGAGGGGCFLFIAPPAKHKAILKALKAQAKKVKLVGARHIPFSFVESGTDILFNNNASHQV
ncbi:MAG: GHMP kinase [Patescibacteria group bacterium]|nr:GHMP kinase [Patescibacteria group bacterium]